MTGRRGSRRKQMLVDVKERRGYWKLKEHYIAMCGELVSKGTMELS